MAGWLVDQAPESSFWRQVVLSTCHFPRTEVQEVSHIKGWVLGYFGKQTGFGKVTLKGKNGLRIIFKWLAK